MYWIDLIVAIFILSPILVSLIYSGTIYSSTWVTHVFYVLFIGPGVWILYDSYFIEIQSMYSTEVYSLVSIMYGASFLALFFMAFISKKPIDMIKRQGAISIEEDPSDRYFEIASVGGVEKTTDSFIVEYHQAQEKWVRSFSSMDEFGRVLSQSDTTHGRCKRCDDITNSIVRGVLIKNDATKSHLFDSRREEVGMTVNYMCSTCFKEISQNIINDPGNKLTEDVLVAHSI